MKSFSVCILLTLIAFSSLAHEVRPAYFSITQTTDSTYQVVWKLPAMGDAIPKIYPTLPARWKVINQNSLLLPGNLRHTFTIQTDGSLGGNRLYFDGLEKTLIDVLVSIKTLNGAQYSAMIKPANPSYIIPAAPDRMTLIKTYGILGIEHILSGVDHLLFVFALMLVTMNFKHSVLTITAFTIAHSITLSLATLGVVGLPGPPVEAMIALSIVFLAVELVHSYQGIEGYTVRFPWTVAFTFGLLHGFGFAGALAEVGLPQNEIPIALLFFNIGVEIGQLLFVTVVVGLLWVVRKARINWPVWFKWIPPYVIGSIAAFWLIERIAGFWM